MKKLKLNTEITKLKLKTELHNEIENLTEN